MSEVDVILVACAVSAGAHAALVPAHLRETVPLGTSFIVAVALLLAVGAGWQRRSSRVWDSPSLCTTADPRADRWSLIPRR
jgi:hypothetical protein